MPSGAREPAGISVRGTREIHDGSTATARCSTVKAGRPTGSAGCSTDFDCSAGDDVRCAARPIMDAEDRVDVLVSSPSTNWRADTCTGLSVCSVTGSSNRKAAGSSVTVGSASSGARVVGISVRVAAVSVVARVGGISVSVAAVIFMKSAVGSSVG